MATNTTNKVIKLAVVRDVFQNHADGMTFQAVCSSREPAMFWGCAQIPDEGKKQGTLEWKHYNTELPNLDWYTIVDVAELYHPWTLHYIEARRDHPRLKTFVTVWDNIPFNRFDPHLTQPILNYADGFIARSRLAADCLRIYADPNKIHIVPAAVDTSLFKPSSKPKKNISSGSGRKPVVLFAGRVVWEKGIQDLMLAAAGQDWKLLIAGDGPYVPFISAYAETANIEVEMLGPVPHENMPLVYQQADVLCYPSIPTQGWIEQFGISVIEALACGLPVVASN